MGWWKIDAPEPPQAGADPETRNNRRNALPDGGTGTGTGETYYNGDGPADSLGEALDRVLDVLGVEWPKPGSWEKVKGVSRREMLDLFLGREVPGRFTGRSKALLEAVDRAWREIDEQYEEEWERPSLQQERLGLCHFVLDPLFD